MGALAGTVVGLLERRHPDARGSLLLELVPALRRHDAHVRLVHPDEGAHRLDPPSPWDVSLLKSGSPAALHLAAGAAAHGTPCLNDPEATRLAQDRLASTAVLAAAGLPVPRSRMAWIGSGETPPTEALDGRTPVLVKAMRGSQGRGLWQAEAGGLAALRTSLPPGPYLVMERVEARGDDLKVFVAGAWMRAIHRPFPALTLAQKRGRPASIPEDVADAARRAGAALGLTCYGCDFVRAADGWWLVDVNAFPGYKGATGAAGAIVGELERIVTEVAR